MTSKNQKKIKDKKPTQKEFDSIMKGVLKVAPEPKEKILKKQSKKNK